MRSAFACAVTCRWAPVFQVASTRARSWGLVRGTLLPGVGYHTFTGRFPGTSADEWTYAEKVVAATGVVSHVVEPTSEGFASEIAQFLWYNELPVGSSSQYAQYCVFRLASEAGITVLLDGQGADELLGGYEQYFRHYVAALRSAGDRKRLEVDLPQIQERYPLALTPPARALRDRLPLRLRRWMSRRLGIGTSLVYGLKPEAARQLAVASRRGQVERFHALSSALYQDSFGMNLTTLLRYGDRNSMAHSREVRLPFCDYRLAELAFVPAAGTLDGRVPRPSACSAKPCAASCRKRCAPAGTSRLSSAAGDLVPRHAADDGAGPAPFALVLREPVLGRAVVAQRPRSTGARRIAARLDDLAAIHR